MKINALITNECEKFLFPEGIRTLDEFIQWLKKSKDMFICMKQLDDDKSCDPYFIEGETKDVYINFSQIATVEEGFAYIISADEYDKMISSVINKFCPKCIYDGDEEMNCNNIEGKRPKINIDEQECWEFESDDEDFDPDDDKGKIYFFNRDNKDK